MKMVNTPAKSRTKDHAIKRGSKWSAIVDLGRQDCRSCPSCRRRYWSEYRGANCERCDSELLPVRRQRRQQWLTGFRTKDDALRAYGEAVHKRENGGFTPPSDETLAEFLLAWLPKMDLKPTTRENYAVNVEAYIIPRIGSIRLKHLKAEDLDGLYQVLRTQGGHGGRPLSRKTVRNVHLVMHKALSSAVRWKKVSANVADYCDLVPKSKTTTREQRRQMTFWSPDELRRFLDHVRTDRLYGAWHLSATSGLRRGELLGLRWQDADLENGTVTVFQNLVLVNHQPTVSTPKSGDSDRAIALDPATVLALKDHRKRQLEERMQWGPAYVDCRLVFTRENGDPIHPDRFSDWFRQHVKAAGLPTIRLHDVRHAYAVAALKAGVPLKVLSQRLGHSTTAMTADIYMHVLGEMDQDAANATARLILGS